MKRCPDGISKGRADGREYADREGAGGEAPAGAETGSESAVGATGAGGGDERLLMGHPLSTRLRAAAESQVRGEVSPHAALMTEAADALDGLTVAPDVEPEPEPVADPVAEPTVRHRAGKKR